MIIVFPRFSGYFSLETQRFSRRPRFERLDMDEQALVGRLQAGEESAFAEVVRIYKDRIVNFIYQMTGDYQKAVDLSQETFVRVYFKADKYKPIAPFSSWVYAIASNLAKTEIKRRRRMALVSIDELPPTLEVSTPSREASDSGLVRNLRQALDALNPRYRIPVILKDIEGYSQEEIARIIDRPIGTVKARISRGRNMLRRQLEKAVHGNSPLREQEIYDGR
jgi:RNA polymerase sigma-70 factor, ECF subfamily